MISRCMFDVLAAMSGYRLQYEGWPRNDDAILQRSDERMRRRQSRREKEKWLHVPADGGDSPVRRTGERTLYARADAGARASLHRRGSGCRGNLRGAAHRRLHHQHASRAWTLPGEGRVAGPHVRGAAGERSGILPRQRRIDAHRRSGDRQPGSECDRGGSVGIATGAAFSAKNLGTGRVAVCFFGEGALGQGSLYEVMNLAQLWKLPVIYVCENNHVQRIHAFFGNDRGRHSGGAATLSDSSAETSMGRMCAPLYAVASRLVRARASRRWPGIFAVRHLSLQRASRRRHQPRILPLKQEEQQWKAERDPIKIARPMADANEATPMPHARRRLHSKLQVEMEAAVKFAIAAPYPECG